MWSEVPCHSCWTPPRKKERGSSVGVHPSDTETRSKPSATQDKQDRLSFFLTRIPEESTVQKSDSVFHESRTETDGSLC